MGTARAKTIKLLLNDGTLEGVMSMADSGWNSGKLFSAPRDSVDDLLSTEACKKYGVYLLLSSKRVYVGQASDLSKRIKQHILGKDWWERVVILTTTDDSFTRSDIDYLESILIDQATKSNTLDCDNKNKGNKPKAGDFREVELDQYLEEALFLLKLIGVTVFDKQTRSVIGKDIIIPTVPSNTQCGLDIRAKREALEYIEFLGMQLNRYRTYARRQEAKDEFWANPKTNVLNENWSLILNNQYNKEIILLDISANTLKLNATDTNGLHCRKDKPERIDLNISSDKLIDRKSCIDFSPFVVKRIKY